MYNLNGYDDDNDYDDDVIVYGRHMSNIVGICDVFQIIGLHVMHTFLFTFGVTLTLSYIFKGKYGVTGLHILQ